MCSSKLTVNKKTDLCGNSKIKKLVFEFGSDAFLIVADEPTNTNTNGKGREDDQHKERNKQRKKQGNKETNKERESEREKERKKEKK